jgi:hypothetical protein
MHRDEKIGPLLRVEIYSAAVAVLEWSASYLSGRLLHLSSSATVGLRGRRPHTNCGYTIEEDISDDRLSPIAYRHPLRR